jgi:hypothetical protein
MSFSRLILPVTVAKLRTISNILSRRDAIEKVHRNHGAQDAPANATDLYRRADTVSRASDNSACFRWPIRHSARYVAVTGISILAPLLYTAVLGKGWAQTPDPQTSGPKIEKQFYSPKDRAEAMRSALLYTPKAVAEADTLQGPAQDKKNFQLRFNDKVICDFDKPGVEKGGKTPKFDCRITRVESPDGQVQVLTDQLDEEPVKVKFGADDNEVYAEIAASRLLWALGYYADAWFPVRVECHNCPADPESGKGDKETRTFDPAIIVRKFQGRKMYEVGKEDQGWSWKEFENVNGRPSYEKDGLKLLAAFIVHGDNKPPQQRLSCKGVNVDQSTNPFSTTCETANMLIQDVGATFGGGMFTSNSTAKMNLGEWSGKKLWKKVGTIGAGGPDGPECQAQLPKSVAATDGLGDPMISEEGRRFAAGLMCQLSDHQIEDLFKAARVAQMPSHHNSDGTFKRGEDESAIVRQWVDAFKKKREDLAAGRCRWKVQPANLTAVDNPAGLPTVPNFCSVRPF